MADINYISELTEKKPLGPEPPKIGDPLGVALETPLDDSGLCEVFSTYWHIQTSTPQETYPAYVEFYRQQSMDGWIDFGADIKAIGPAFQYRCIPATHRHLDVMHSVLHDNEETGDGTVRNLRVIRMRFRERLAAFGDSVGPPTRSISISEIVDRSIDSLVNLCFRIWCMVDFARLPPSLEAEQAHLRVCHGRPVVRRAGEFWKSLVPVGSGEDGQESSKELHLAIKEAFEDSLRNNDFPAYAGPLLKSRVPLSARNLHRLAEITVRPTENLWDHLRYEPSSRSLYVFKYTELLTRRWIAAGPRGFPGSRSPNVNVFHSYHFLRELLFTYDLIFPTERRKDKHFLSKIQREHDLSEQMLNVSHDRTGTQFLLINVQRHFKSDEDLHYYRHRLAILFNVLNGPGVVTVRQLLVDRRNMTQWLTFWVAVAVFILTVVFGIISSATGIMQSYFSYRAFKMEESSGPS